MKDDRVYLKHILDEISFLRRISEGKSLDDLIHDNYYSHAVRSVIEPEIGISGTFGLITGF